MIEFNANIFITPDVNRLLSRLNLESGGKVQQAIDKAVIDWDLQYVPWETGLLAKNPYAVTDIGSGTVVYQGPYARYQYYGEVYGPNIPIFDDDTDTPSGFFSPPEQEKHPTGRDLQYKTETNPLAGSYWFERMKADHVDDIVEEARRNVGK